MDLTQIAANLKGVDWSSLETELGGLVHEAFMPLVEGEAEDVKAFGLAIAKDMVGAIVSGNQLDQAQLKGQIKLLAEISRIRANAASWEFAGQAASLIFKAAVAALGVAAKA